jgi:2-iminobutanoate/2-iminopropanoate deaminase
MMATREVLGVDAVEPYSRIVKARGFVYIKSHIGYDEAGEYPPDIEAQTRNTLRNLEKSLATAGSGLDRLLRICVYLSNIDDDFDGFDAAYGAFFRERRVDSLPARTTIGVPLSWPQLLVQMDLIAVE